MRSFLFTDRRGKEYDNCNRKSPNIRAWIRASASSGVLCVALAWLWVTPLFPPIRWSFGIPYGRFYFYYLPTYNNAKHQPTICYSAICCWHACWLGAGLAGGAPRNRRVRKKRVFPHISDANERALVLQGALVILISSIGILQKNCTLDCQSK